MWKNHRILDSNEEYGGGGWKTLVILEYKMWMKNIKGSGKILLQYKLERFDFELVRYAMILFITFCFQLVVMDISVSKPYFRIHHIYIYLLKQSGN